MVVGGSNRGSRLLGVCSLDYIEAIIFLSWVLVHHPARMEWEDIEGKTRGTLFSIHGK